MYAMKSFHDRNPRHIPFSIEEGQRMMLKCAGGYIFASATAGALGVAGIGDFSLSAVVLLLLLSALLLAAGLLCSALGTLVHEEHEPNERGRNQVGGRR